MSDSVISLKIFCLLGHTYSANFTTPALFGRDSFHIGMFDNGYWSIFGIFKLILLILFFFRPRMHVPVAIKRAIELSIGDVPPV